MRAIMALARGDLTLGDQGRLPWRIPGDLKRFAAYTADSTMIVGRKTWEGMPPSFRLKGRRVLILSRSGDEGTVSLEHVLAQRKEDGFQDAWVIGGKEVYEALLPYCTQVFATLVDGAFRGDVKWLDGRFPSPESDPLKDFREFLPEPDFWHKPYVLKDAFTYPDSQGHTTWRVLVSRRLAS